MIRGLLFAALFLSAPTCAVFGGKPSKASVPVKFGANVLNVEVAATEAEREHGLMFRRDLGDDEGMIFVFDSPHEASFWMKDTPLPLSIAFLDSDKRVLNVDQMASYDDQTYHRSNGEALYAIEAKQGWFEKRGIKSGDQAEFDLK